MTAYRGITYPVPLGWQPFFWLWRRFCCPREMHLLDEVESLAFEDHSLVCDACHLRINIAGFDTTYMRASGGAE